jgi:Rrf2 family protein
MSLLTKKSVYGLMAIYELYKQKDSFGPIQLKDISKSTGIPQNYLEQIVIELKKANLIKSTRGAKGGYKIVDREREILIKDVVMILDGELSTIKDETKNPIFNLLFDDFDKKLVQIFNKPLSYIENYEQMLNNQINYSI